MKLCKDCKHVVWRGNNPRCNRTGEPFVDKVTGEIWPGRWAAEVERMGIDAADCGPDAKHFEPKDAAPAAAAE